MFGSLLGVVMNAIFLSYVKKLEHDKCECAEDKLRDYIKYFSAAMIGLFLLRVLLSVLSLKVKVPVLVQLVLLLTILGAGVYQVYALFKYSHKLVMSKPECECSKDDWRRSVMFYFSIFYAIMVFLALHLVLFLIAYSSMSKNNRAEFLKKIKKQKRQIIKKNKSIFILVLIFLFFVLNFYNFYVFHLITEVGAGF